LRLMAAIRRGRADVAAGRTKSHAEVEQSLESWASAWNSK
jgi:predicted transcriptional regulator